MLHYGRVIFYEFDHLHAIFVLFCFKSVYIRHNVLVLVYSRLYLYLEKLFLSLAKDHIDHHEYSMLHFIYMFIKLDLFIRFGICNYIVTR